MKLLLKQSEEIIDAADARFRLTPGERRFLLGALKGEGLLFARGGRWPIRIEASPAEHRLATSNPRELVDLMRERTNRMPHSSNGFRDELNGASTAMVAHQ
jgi:hypothetical protein